MSERRAYRILMFGGAVRAGLEAIDWSPNSYSVVLWSLGCAGLAFRLLTLLPKSVKL